MSDSKTNHRRVIAITGGIGSGKSVVSAMLAAMGFDAYDCDAEAKVLMDNDSDIKARIAAEVTPEALCEDGSLDRPAIAAAVFADSRRLSKLNSIVHGAVRNHLEAWIEKKTTLTSGPLFVETAILYQSGLDAMVDEVWEVCAPVALRIERVISRNGCQRAEVEARIASQDSFVPTRKHPRVNAILNDGITPVLPCVEKLLREE